MTQSHKKARENFFCCFFVVLSLFFPPYLHYKFSSISLIFFFHFLHRKRIWREQNVRWMKRLFSKNWFMLTIAAIHIKHYVLGIFFSLLPSIVCMCHFHWNPSLSQLFESISCCFPDKHNNNNKMQPPNRNHFFYLHSWSCFSFNCFGFVSHSSNQILMQFIVLRHKWN